MFFNNGWWKSKTAYQIYPKSFCDSNGDGIGDIQGIISKLDYLKDLGVDIIWISPMYKSPFADQGYDISDYYNVDPVFGTMDDMDELIAEVKKRKMYLIMDLVVNHCSDEHEWFKAAIADPTGEYARYFYIEEMKDGKFPNNVRSYFGGSCWKQIEGTNYCYLHSFHEKQPDLNWENPELRAEIYKMMNWWLDKGISGFRVDAIMNIKKELPWRDYEPDRDDGMCFVGNMCEHTTAGAIEILKEMRRATTDNYDEVFTVGEVFNAAPELIEGLIGKGGAFSTMFDFSSALLGAASSGWQDYRPVEKHDFMDSFIKNQEFYQEHGVFMANIIENHDEPRGVSRYLSDEDRCLDSEKMLAGIYFFAKGIPFIYQGQELGMQNGIFTSVDEFDDVNTIAEYETAIASGKTPEEAVKAVSVMSRDNARSPMQWDDSENAGFTTGTPWLKVHDDYKEINAAAEVADKDSLFSFYKKMIALKKNPVLTQTLTSGSFGRVDERPEDVLAYTRGRSGQNLCMIANWSNAENDFELPGQMLYIWLNSQKKADIEGNTVHLKPYQFLVLEYYPGDELPG